MPLLNPLALVSACFGHSLSSPCPSFPIFLCWYYEASFPSFPVSLYGLTATLLAHPVPSAPCCLVPPQPVSHLPFWGWRALVDFCCSVFSLSAFMHALMSSSCPISPTCLISCFANSLRFFSAGVPITLVGLSPPFCYQTSFWNLLFYSRLVLMALWCLFSWAAPKSFHPVVFSPPHLALVLAFPCLLLSLLLGAPCLCSGSQFLPLL